MRKGKEIFYLQNSQNWYCLRTNNNFDKGFQNSILKVILSILKILNM